MIAAILFYGIGIIALYLLYMIVRKQFRGECAGCPKQGECKNIQKMV